MNKMKAIIGSMALVAVALAPLALAHDDDTQHPAAAVVGSHGSGNGDRVSGYYYKDVSALVGHTGMDVDEETTTSFTFGAANALCDMEVLSPGADDPLNAIDEPEVDGTENTDSLTTTLFNDGGVGAVCHTHDGYYANEDYNTSGCEYEPASGADVSTRHVWITTVCDYGYATGGIGLVSYLQSCANNLLTGEPLNLVTCVTNVANCFTSSPAACPLDTGFECGTDEAGAGGVQTAGQSGWNNQDGGVLFDQVPAPCLNEDGAAAVFVWTAVFVDSVGGTPVDVSVPTVGWIG